MMWTPLMNQSSERSSETEHSPPVAALVDPIELFRPRFQAPRVVLAVTTASATMTA